MTQPKVEFVEVIIQFPGEAQLRYRFENPILEFDVAFDSPFIDVHDNYEVRYLQPTTGSLNLKTRGAFSWSMETAGEKP